MSAALSIQILGLVRGGRFSPNPIQPCSCFKADRIAIGSTAWSSTALVIQDSSVSPRHALVMQEDDHWVIQDMDSDNGIRAIASVGEIGAQLETGQPNARFEFHDDFSCCVGAVVLRFRALAPS
jgi:hypothetical protein